MSGFEELRETLFGDEQRRLYKLEQEILQKDKLAANIAPALARTFRIAKRDATDLADAMEDPLIEATALAARRNTYRLSEALAPIMGAAIRKGITGAMRAFIEQIDALGRQACSLDGFRWRFEAWRTGIPFAEIALKHSLQYQVQDVFLIHRASGLLLAHTSNNTDITANHHSVAAMLVAIQDFVKDAVFAGSDALHTINAGESTIWLCYGELALLACVIKGAPPNKFRDEMQTVLNDLHALYQQPLKNFVNNNEPLPQIPEHLRPLLKSERSNSPAGKAGIGLTATIVGLLLATPVAYYSWRQLQQQRAVSRLEQIFSTEPGYYVTNISLEAGRYVVRGLADPIALRKSAELMQKSGLHESRVQLSLAPYLSLDPDLVRTRIVETLQPPPEVKLKVEGKHLQLAGVAELAWKRRAEVVAAALPYFDSVNTEQLDTVQQRTLQRLQEEISGTHFYFDESIELTPQSVASQETVDRLVKDFVAMAEVLDVQPCLRIIGYSDGLGGDQDNAKLRERRVELIRSRLTRLGVSASKVSTETFGANNTQADPRLRRVDIVAQPLVKGKACS